VSVAFILTTLVVVATPGTGAVYSIAAGLSRGVRAGIVAAFGCTLGVVPHMVAATMRSRVLSRPKVMAWMRRTFAGTYVLLAGRLALESR
jgi:threonine/homoserine/homoserine lactone efflux protein